MKNEDIKIGRCYLIEIDNQFVIGIVTSKARKTSRGWVLVDVDFINCSYYGMTFCAFYTHRFRRELSKEEVIMEMLD